MTKDEALKMAIEAFDNIDMSNQTNEECARAWFIEGYVQALEWPPKEALEQPLARDWKETIDERIAKDDEFKRALEQPAQEPVAWMSEGGVFTRTKEHAESWSNHGGKVTPVYTHPAPSWHGLSDDEIHIICAKMAAKLPNKEIDLIFARAIEQALKEKNNGTT